MKMKRYTVVLLFFSFLFLSCNETKNAKNEQVESLDTSEVLVKIIVDFETPLKSGQINLRNSDQTASIFKTFDLTNLKHFEEDVKFSQAAIFQFQFDENYIPLLISLEEKIIKLKISNIDSKKLNYEVLSSKENENFHNYLLRFSPNSNSSIEHKKLFLDSISPSFAASEIYFFEFETSYNEYQNNIEGIKTKFANKNYASKLVNLISSKESNPIAIGKKVPDFLLTTINGKSVGPQSFKGKYLLLDFWASWCGPCRAEVPNVKEAYKKYRSKGFEVLGISTDQDNTSWQNAVKQMDMQWTSVRDASGEVSTLFNIQYIPTVYLIGPDGTILAENVRGKKLEELLSKYLDTSEKK